MSRIFYKTELNWIGPPIDDWSKIRIFAFLNHTSLFEPLFASAFPLSYLWYIAPHLLVPGADKTLKRPITGLFFKLFAPRMVAISRKRDATWKHFMSLITPQSLIALAPEGRMKRLSGLDSNNRPMSIRGGIVDIIDAIPTGKLLLGHSGGLHHVQPPDQFRLKLFQTIKINFEVIDIAAYKCQFKGRDRRVMMLKDLELRLQNHKPD